MCWTSLKSSDYCNELQYCSVLLKHVYGFTVTASSFILFGYFVPRENYLIVTNKNYVTFLINDQPMTEGPLLLPNQSLNSKTLSENVTLGNEVSGRTERHSKLKHERRWHAGKVV
jgi:hypothetical protein